MTGWLGFVLFQAGWFANVAAAGAGRPWWGVATTVALLLFHVARTGAGRRVHEAAIVLAIALFGTGIDTAFEQWGVLAYPPGGRLAVGLCPLWISGLWALFATALRGPLRWLGARTWLAVLFGAIGSGSSFLGAERFGAVTLTRPLLAPLILIGLAWAVATPLLLEWAAAVATTTPSTTSRRRIAVGAIILVACGVVLPFVGGGRSPASVHAALLRLAKNAPLAGAELATLPLQFRHARGTTSLSVRWWHSRPPSGAPRRPPLLLIHGTPSTLFTFTHLIRSGRTVHGIDYRGLAEDFELLVPDLPGHGATTPLPAPCTFEAQVEFLAQFLAAVGAPPLVVVGHSYGGEVALRLAASHPDRVTQLVLIDSSGFHRPDVEVPDEELPLKRHPLAPFGRLLTSLDDTRDALRISFVGAVPEDEAQENYLVLDSAANWRTMIDLARDEEGHAQAAIATLALPTLLLWGAGDRNFPPSLHARRFATAIRGSTVAIIDGSGHYLPVERPDAVVAALRAFVVAR